jgi:hypothetical protein
VLHSDQRAVHSAPKIRVKQPAVIFLRGFVEPAVEADARVIDPCVEGSKALDGHVGYVNQLVALGDVCRNVGDLATRIAELPRDFAQRLLIAGGEHHLGATLGGRISRRQTDSTRGARDHDGLFVEWFESDRHGAASLAKMTGERYEEWHAKRMP